jgi:ABC-type multidrug transport system fused ATPase/permease subunit
MCSVLCIGGSIIAFVRGWKFSLVMVGFFPPIFIVVTLMTKMLQEGFTKGMKGYAKSGGYAEQALNAIKVVSATSQEKKEITNYSNNLEEARRTSESLKKKGAVGYGAFYGVLVLIYGYIYYFGGVFVYEEIENDVTGKIYTASDILTIFFGMIFAVFSLGMLAPNLTAVAEGQAGAASAFEIIDRSNKILLDDPIAKPLTSLKGEILFKNVVFSYPERPEKALDGVDLRFESGKTTAIVGASGSGKSTCVQLIERFYDPESGVILVDGNELKSINLRDYRRKIGYVG